MDLWGNEDEEERAERIRKSIRLPEFSSHEELKKALDQCHACRLRNEGGYGPVLSTGPCPAPLMLVGEGPGGVEDDYGAPLIGPSGQLLDKALYSVGITRDHVYVTNIVKCRPHHNRTPTMEEGFFCASRWLAREIRLCRPKVIVALGKPALRFFLGRDAGIIRSRGHWIQWNGIPVMPTFHPAYLLRQVGHAQVEAKWQVYYDLKAAKERAAEAAPEWVWQSGTMPNIIGTLGEERARRHSGNQEGK
jgi:uracil-DNA glycosylase family 4